MAQVGEFPSHKHSFMDSCEKLTTFRNYAGRTQRLVAGYLGVIKMIKGNNNSFNLDVLALK